MIPYYKPDKWNGILVVGERPRKEDYKNKRPFMSTSGLELSALCSKAGFHLSECAMIYAHDTMPEGGDMKSAFVTKAVWKEGKDKHTEVNGHYITNVFYESIIRLHHAIAKIQPKMIIALGEGGLFGCITERSIDSYRGSMLYWQGTINGKASNIRLLPTHGTDRLFKQYHLRYLVSHDLRRAYTHLGMDWPGVPERFLIRPSYEETISTLGELIQKAKDGAHISVDIETRLHRFISCIGFAWSESDAICIPLINAGTTRGFYWTVEEETEIVLLIRELLQTPSIRVSGQNYHYDSQYLALHWGIRSHIWRDTLVLQHTFFSSEMAKDLNTISSLYCENHVYWKDEGKGHEPDEEGEEAYWIYNCKDCCRTWEAAETMEKVVPSFEMEGPVEFQHRMWHHLLRVMVRGVRYDLRNRQKQKEEVASRMRKLERFIESLVPPSVCERGKTPFYKSPKQLSTLFYQTLGIKPVTIRDKKTRRWKPTTEDSALSILAVREPVIKPLCEAIAAHRSLQVYYSTFLTPNPDPLDNRMRSGYKLSHPSTYRLASAGDVFDYGLNLQNLPKGDEDE